MKLQHLICTLFFTLIAGVTCCMAQIKTSLSKDSISERPKLITNQSTDQATKASHNIHCGLLDRAGNLWFGTTGDGVYRFDGKSFVNFTAKDGLSDNCVWSVLEDKAGNIWFGTNAGICCYDGKNIIDHPIRTTDSSSLRQGIYSMLQDKSGIIWFGTASGVYCYSGKSLTPFLESNHIINQSGLRLKMAERILEDKSGNIWFCSGMGGNEGICRYDGKSITSFKPNGDVWVPYILEDKKGNIWFSGRSHGYFRFDGKAFTDFTEKAVFSLSAEEQAGNFCLAGKAGFGPMAEDKSGNIWFTGKMIRFGGNGGIWRYDGTSCINYTVKDGLGDYGIWCMVEDTAGNIWIGTNNTGLFCFDGQTFTRFSE